MYQRILLPTDGSKRSDRAARQAIALAKGLGASITALHSVPTEQMFLDQSFVTPVTISQSLKNQFKKQAAKSKCDLIMMASHGRKGISGALLGSETAKVLAHSEVPVLVVR